MYEEKRGKTYVECFDNMFFVLCLSARRTALMVKDLF